MSRSPVSYDRKTRERARLESKPMFCISINREYCKHLPENQRSIMTLWGPASDDKANDVARLLLKLSGVKKEDIDILYPQPARD